MLTRLAICLLAWGLPTDAPVKLPPHWNGVGVLATAPVRPPRGAPTWTRVEAEVVERDGARFLRTVGRVDDLADGSLGRSTAENRARAVMSRWLQQEKVDGAEPIDYWHRSRGQVHIARVEKLLDADSLK